MTLAELVGEFNSVHAPGWLALDVPTMIQIAVDATRYYAGYGNLKSYSAAHQTGNTSGDPHIAVQSPEDITEDTEVSNGEWAIIRPLFWLYLERRNAQLLEATRAGGVEMFGRTVSEVQQDITIMENETLPAKAFQSTLIEVS